MSDPTNEPGLPCEALDPRSETGGLDGLFRPELRPLVRLVTLLVGSFPQAEEIVQDAFAVVGERWTELESPGGYLRVTVVNGCRMVLRRR